VVLSSLEAEHAGLALALPIRLALPLSSNTFRESIVWLEDKKKSTYTCRAYSFFDLRLGVLVRTPKPESPKRRWNLAHRRHAWPERHGVSAIQVLDRHRQYRHGPLGQGNTDVVSPLGVHWAPDIIRYEGQRCDVKAVYRSYGS
jgi:hypothetical protein